MSDTAEDRSTSTRHQGLDRQDVIEAALDLVERRGSDALTMRKLAAELGVTPTTIYWHVGNREELVLAVVRQQAARQATAKVSGRTAEERVLSAARNIWRSAIANRNVTALANQAGATTLLALPLEVALVAELDAAGVRGAAARDALRSVLAVVAGFLVLAWRRDDGPHELRPSVLWSGIDDERLSARTLAALGGRSDPQRMFDATMRSVVAGILAGVAAPEEQRPEEQR